MADKRKDDQSDAAAEAEQPALLDQPTERVPCTVGHISGLASANAPQDFFDDAPFCGYFRSVGDITLTAGRHIYIADGHGVVGDRVVTGILRGSLEALRALKGCIEAIEKLAEKELADTIAAATGGPPSGMAH